MKPRVCPHCGRLWVTARVLHRCRGCEVMTLNPAFCTSACFQRWRQHPPLTCLWCHSVYPWRALHSKSGRTFCRPSCSQRWRADAFNMRARRNRGRRTRYGETHP